MNESSTGQGRNILAWVRVIGWQIVALVLVISLGKSASRISSSWANRTDSHANVIEDAAKFTGFISDCLPEASKKEIKALVTDATDLAVRQARRELDRERQRDMSRDSRPFR